MRKKLILTLAALAGLVAMVLLPVLHAVVLLGNLVAHCFVLGLQVMASRLPRFRPGRLARLERRPFVSIHVPAHNEPPELLSETLRALANVPWESFEVLVIDNNTTDPDLWEPIGRLCEELGPRFRFFHVEGLKGAKAGALNYVRRFMDPRAEFVFVVDADYVVEPDCLEEGLRHFTEDRVGLVQFPQEYRNVGPENLGVALDFKHFFAGYMNMANHLGAVPSTGTLTFLRVEALRDVGGFDPVVVTEDAEIGFRLNARGWRSVFVSKVIGRGVLPHDLESLKKQRWRWAFGNAQILRLNWREIVLGRRLTLRQRIGYLAHLTAWFNFNLLPSVTLILLAPIVWLERLHPVQPYLVVLSGFTLTTFLVLRFGTVYYSLRGHGHSVGDVVRAFLVHLGLGWVFSASWMKCLLDPRSPFVRTNKFLGRHMPGILRTTLAELTLGVGLLGACIVLTLSDFLIGPLAALLIGGARFLVYWVAHETRQTLRLTRRLVESWSAEPEHESGVDESLAEGSVRA